VKIDWDLFTFKSGQTFIAERGIFGIDENGTVTEGYDSIVYRNGKGNGVLFSADDMVEIAEMMIDRWTDFLIKMRES